MTFRKKIAFGFGIGFGILIFVAVLSFRSILQSDEDRVWVIHTHQVLEQVDVVVTDLLNAETGERGFILTGEPSFLDPYNVGIARIDMDVAQLRNLTSDNPVQRRNLQIVEPLILERLQMLRDRVEVRRQSDLITGAEIVRQGPGKQHMDKIRAQLAEMKAEENRLLVLRTAEALRSSRATRIMIITGEILANMFLCLAGVVVAQEMRRRRRAEFEIQQLNVDLEKRVESRTAELVEQTKELARSNNDLQQFAYVASHDLQEPLRMVASFTQLLAKRYSEKLDDDARDFINYAVDGATRMQTLISDLLNYSRVGTQGNPLVPTDSAALVKRVLESLQCSIEESGAVVVLDSLPFVVADPQQLGQLFQNLLANAIKFRREEPPQVRIFADRMDNGWKISVQDNGIGISAEHNDRVFIIFQRLHTKTEYPGTGIGLAICKKIVERHGGRIWIEPSPGGGTTVCFTISGAKIQSEGSELNELRIPAHAH